MTALRTAGALAALSAALGSGADYRAMQRALPRSLSQRIRDRIRSRDAKSTKPERLFEDMIRSGEVSVVRRRGKCPLLVRAP